LRKFEVAYFTASCDTVELNTKFAKSLELDYSILSDPSGKAAKAYGVVSAKRSFPQRWTFYIGKDGKILYIDKKVKAGTHGKDMAARLKQLGVAEKKSKTKKKKS